MRLTFVGPRQSASWAARCLRLALWFSLLPAVQSGRGSRSAGVRRGWQRTDHRVVGELRADEGLELRAVGTNADPGSSPRGLDSSSAQSEDTFSRQGIDVHEDSLEDATSSLEDGKKSYLQRELQVEATNSGNNQMLQEAVSNSRSHRKQASEGGRQDLAKAADPTKSEHDREAKSDSDSLSGDFPDQEAQLLGKESDGAKGDAVTNDTGVGPQDTQTSKSQRASKVKEAAAPQSIAANPAATSAASPSLTSTSTLAPASGSSPSPDVVQIDSSGPKRPGSGAGNPLKTSATSDSKGKIAAGDVSTSDDEVPTTLEPEATAASSAPSPKTGRGEPDTGRSAAVMASKGGGDGGEGGEATPREKAREQGAEQHAKEEKKEHEEQREEAPSIWLKIVAILMALFGLLVLWLAVPLLWTAERVQAARRSLAYTAWSDATRQNPEEVTTDLDGQFVHVQGNLTATTAVFDRCFPAVGFNSGCVKLRTTCQVYRWVETCEKAVEARPPSSRGENSPSGLTYRYCRAWCDTFEPDFHFQDACGHSNGPRPELPLGVSEETCISISLGKYTVPPALIDVLDDFRDISDKIGPSITAKMLSQPVKFSLEEDGYYIARVGRRPPPPQQKGQISTLLSGSGLGAGGGEEANDGNGDEERGAGEAGGGGGEAAAEAALAGSAAASAAEISFAVGDLRLKFEAVLDGPVTIVGLQKHSCNRATFAPLRPIQRRLCGWSDREERSARLLEASKTYKEVSDGWLCRFEGLCGCICLCCNVATRCLDTRGSGAEVLCLSQGHKGLDEILGPELRRPTFHLWALRLVGYCLTCIACMALLSSLRLLLGYDLLSSTHGVFHPTVACESLVCALVVWAFLASITNFFFQPRLGLALLSLLGVATSSILIFTHSRGGRPPSILAGVRAVHEWLFRR